MGSQQNGPRIDWLNDRQETAYHNMLSAFDSASNAHSCRDGASARMYADQGHAYKAESQGYVQERRDLVQQIRDARERHEATRPAFERAKSNFEHWRSQRDQANQQYQQARKEFFAARDEHKAAKEAFQARLAVVRAERERRRSDRRSIAERAGVPLQYLDNVWVSRDPNGTHNIYFGGVGKPNGPGHGHYAMDRDGNVTYRREPFDPHGSENFTDREGQDPDRNRVRKAGRVAKVVVTTAWGIAQAATSPSMAAGALPGHQEDAKLAGENWKNAAQTEQRDNQTRTLRSATRDKGVRDRGTSQSGGGLDDWL